MMREWDKKCKSKATLFTVLQGIVNSKKQSEYVTRLFVE